MQRALVCRRFRLSSPMLKEDWTEPLEHPIGDLLLGGREALA